MATEQEAKKELASILGIKDWLQYTRAYESAIGWSRSKRNHYIFELKRVDRYSGEIQIRHGKSWKPSHDFGMCEEELNATFG